MSLSKCPRCLAHSVREVVTATAGHSIAAEIESLCGNCGAVVGLWAYGYDHPGLASLWDEFEGLHAETRRPGYDGPLFV